MKKILFFLSILLILIPSLSFGTDYYVSSSGSGGSGSKASPWGPSEIPWSSWESGATDIYLYFFGGTYTNTLAIRHNYTGNRIYIKPGSASPSPSSISGLVTFSRTAGNNITLYNGSYPAHNVTIDGETTSGSGTRNILINPGAIPSNAANGCIQGYTGGTTTGNKMFWIEFTGANSVMDPYGHGYLIHITAGTGTEIAYNYFHDNICYNEISIYTAQNAYGIASIHHNTIETGSVNYIFSQGGVDIYNNVLDASGAQPAPYDILHAFSTGHLSYFRIYNNYFNSKDQMLFFEPKANGADIEHVRIYNNVFTDTTSIAGKPILIEETYSFNIDDFIVANNTFCGVGYGVRFAASSLFGVQTVNLTNFKITNNIFSVVSGQVMWATSGLGIVTYANEADAVFDYNLLYPSVSFSWLNGPGGARTTYSSLATFATDHPTYSHNKNLNPLLISSTNFRLQAGSSAINVGYNATAYTNMDALWPKDKDGITRPVGSGWDIGAYEFGGSEEDTDPPIISNALPSGVQACDAGSPVDITLSVTTNENATCKYDTSNTTYDLMANTYGTTGVLAHSQVIPLACDDSYTYYTRCMDDSVLHNKNTTSTTHSFSITPVPTGDVTPPVMVNAGPTGNLVCTSNPRDVVLQVTATDETPLVDCKYDTSDTTYDLMAGTFGTKVGNDFSHAVSLACGSPYTYYYRCADGVPNKNISSVSATFTVLSPTIPGMIQGEDGDLVEPMASVADATADGGFYIASDTVNSGTATFTVAVAVTGTYRIIARAFAVDSGTDSITLKIDALDADTWDLNPSSDPNFFNVWFLDYVTKRGTGTFDHPQYDPYQVELTAGNHTFVFTGRERNARLDYFYLESVEIPSQPPFLPTNVFMVGTGMEFIVGDVENGQTFRLD